MWESSRRFPHTTRARQPRSAQQIKPRAPWWWEQNEFRSNVILNSNMKLLKYVLICFVFIGWLFKCTMYLFNVYIFSNGEDGVYSSCAYVDMPLLDADSGCKCSVSNFKWVSLGFLTLEMMVERGFLFYPVTYQPLPTPATAIVYFFR